MKGNMKKVPQNEIAIYRAKDGRAALEVSIRGETIWLSLQQMADLFERDKSVISRHIRTIYATGELARGSTVAKTATVQNEGGRRVTREIEFFSLDMILSVGYRVNSRRGTEFRIWATSILKDHLIQGYTLNEKRLQAQITRFSELQAALDVMARVISEKAITGPEAEGLLRVITDYSLALRLLDQYDHQQLRLHATTEIGRFVLTCDAARAAIVRMAETMGALADGFFGREKDKGLESAIGAVYQTFGGRDLYPSIEEKAAHLLYFVVKNHAFVDGNKRIGAFLFIWFLDANGLLYREAGTKRLADNALVALTLLIAESRPTEKDTLCKVIVNLINRENL
ncbi:MAG: virulence protein RhuM/Fic/DOC family protein [bacterium]